MKVIGGIFHRAGKIVSYNPIQIPRIDEMEHYDSIFTEMNVRDGGLVRLVAAMSLLKPATMWTTSVPSPDDFAVMLLHGVFPMAPSPRGDHSLGLEGLAQYLEFGPMLRALQGRIWRLEPHAIHATALNGSRDVAANLFDVPDGSRLAVVAMLGSVGATNIRTAADDDPTATNPVYVNVTLGNGGGGGSRCEVLQVGRWSKWTPVAGSAGGGGVIRIPVASNIAMLRIK